MSMPPPATPRCSPSPSRFMLPGLLRLQPAGRSARVCCSLRDPRRDDIGDSVHRGPSLSQICDGGMAQETYATGMLRSKCSALLDLIPPPLLEDMPK
ncbi:hypothetical protein TRIUR3_33446 [Triticum urartu]|uniref:Uncharacterized protein n=1 Tax=Triticum urartu TaxID=4572 RepID=M8A0K6_TRIUA|nr:hypothetical protein TRIUR3_33446 [Triticum urartu]